MEFIQDFLTNLRPIINLLAIVIGAYLLLLWAASVLWAYRDIRMRSEDVSVQVLAVGLVLAIPFAGIPLHMMLRPRQTLAERYERTLEEEYLRRDIEEKFTCPACHRPIEPDFLLCPYCHTALRRNCVACNRVIDLTWSICPYCGNDGQHNVLDALQGQPRYQHDQAMHLHAADPNMHLPRQGQPPGQGGCPRPSGNPYATDTERLASTEC